MGSILYIHTYSTTKNDLDRKLLEHTVDNRETSKTQVPIKEKSNNTDVHQVNFRTSLSYPITKVWESILPIIQTHYL